MKKRRKRKEFIWEIETEPFWHGYEWRVAPSPSTTGKKDIEWGPWVGTHRSRSSAIRAARRYCRRMTRPNSVWRDVERVKL